MNKKNYIKSPLVYTGCKYKLLEQIIPLFPYNINTFYDLFGGSGTVVANVNANNYIYNELNLKIKDLIEWISTCDGKQEVKNIMEEINKFNLSKGNKEKYYIFRREYNESPSNIWLFILACFSLNYSIRFNSKGEFNQSCGNRAFSDNIKNNFISFNNKMKNSNVKYINSSFDSFKNFKKNDFVYLDPPYLPTVVAYTENGGWNEEKERNMYNYIDWLNSINVKFALSNVSIYRNKENTILQDWMKKYNIYNLNFKYKNNNFNKKDNTAFTQEVLITNY